MGPSFPMPLKGPQGTLYISFPMLLPAPLIIPNHLPVFPYPINTMLEFKYKMSVMAPIFFFF